MMAKHLLTSLVGQSEEQAREALLLADAVAVREALVELESGGNLDSGIVTRVKGILSAWLRENASEI